MELNKQQEEQLLEEAQNDYYEAKEAQANMLLDDDMVELDE